MFHGVFPPITNGANLIQNNQHSVETSKFANHIWPNFEMGLGHVQFSSEGGAEIYILQIHFYSVPFKGRIKNYSKIDKTKSI